MFLKSASCTTLSILSVLQTDIHNIYLSDNAGDPYLDLFEPTTEEKQVKMEGNIFYPKSFQQIFFFLATKALADARLEAEINGQEWVEPDLFSIMVYLELQFYKKGAEVSTTATAYGPTHY